jgi:hydrogenase maturation protein HypF
MTCASLAKTERGGAAQRLRIRVHGVVQGVGFRPHVWQIAQRHSLSGFVLNDGAGVLIEAQGSDVAAFLSDIEAEAPPLARVVSVGTEAVPLCIGEAGFEIRASIGSGPVRTGIMADIATCPDCLQEILTPTDRRHLYPFTTCTHCGPRFTVTGRLPYDRATTSLQPFPLCAPCAAEYADPRNRRFHAETTCCPDCGPKLAVPVADIAQHVRDGRIVALKGLGGFHLVCDARQPEVVERLRSRKRRDGKPFAVMVTNIASAQRLASIDDAASRLLAGRQRPIVLVPARPDAGLAEGVGRGLATVGLLLPYTPLHWLLFRELLGRPYGSEWREAGNELALVATSANRSGEPIAIDDEEAVHRLAGIADVVAGHDRAILVRADDSVMHVVDGAPAFVRRSRGIVPLPIPLPSVVPPVAALGAHLKATVTVTRGAEAFVSQHVGDLDTPEAVGFLAETYAHLCRILDVRPAAVAVDLHADLASNRLAGELELPVVEVQHHHAHTAAIAAEHGHAGPLLGLSLDGFGLGSDGAAWGGELLVVDGAAFRRWGHLSPLPLPGGDRAAREPWRMAAAALHELGRGAEIAERFAEEPLAAQLGDLLRKNRSLARTSSAGRLFDAAAGLLGVSRRQAFEGEAAMRLEGLVRLPKVADGGWTIESGLLDMRPLLGLLADCVDPAHGASVLHGTLAAALADWVRQAALATGTWTVALGGGCFLNRQLTDLLAGHLREAGLNPLVARQVPPNDGGLSLGQAWIAGQIVGSRNVSV